MATERRKHTEELKQEAVRLMETSGKAIAELARDLGINDNNRYRWRNRYGWRSDPTANGNRTDMKAELKRSAARSYPAAVSERKARPAL